MGSVSSEEGSEERSGSYTLSADVSESESSSDVSGGASSSSAFSPFAAGSSAPSTPAFTFPLIGGESVPVWDGKSQKRSSDSSEIKMMKEKFAKLLLGEDMSGGGKGVCSALAISNSITNLSATVFGELWKLEPIAPQKKSMWRREMEWLLSISDSIVEFHPTIRHFPGGGTYEVMAARPRSDICMNMPALKKLDVMLISILDGFRGTEFSYANRGIVMDDCDRYPITTSGRPSVRQEEKWWLPCPKVPGNGLSEDARKRLQQCRDCANQILKAALAINSNVLAEMDIPAAYIETLPKNGRDCLGDSIYRHINADHFSPECILDSLDLSSEHRTADVVNRIEAALHVWKMKEKKQIAWGGMVMGFVADGERSQFLGQRAETLLHILKIRFPCLPQTALDMTKIEYNKDVGQSILESYSRVMESLAFNIIARIDDVLYVDDATRCSAAEGMSNFNRGGGFNGMPIQKKMCPSPFSIEHRPYMSPPTLYSSPSSARFMTPLNKNTRSLSLEKDLDNLWANGGDASERD